MIIIDNGMGNLGSIINMIKKIGYTSQYTSNIEEIKRAKKLILPGVGNFDKAMDNLTNSGLVDILNQKVLIEKTPILGICLGMQLMTNKSDEGNKAGLGWIDAQVKKFTPVERTLKVPHMGWNIIQPEKRSVLLHGFKEEIRAYFVHSYFIQCHNKQDVVATTPYCSSFVSVFEHDNIFGMQFHPEKSHQFGMKMLSNFIEY